MVIDSNPNKVIWNSQRDPILLASLRMLSKWSSNVNLESSIISWEARHKSRLIWWNYYYYDHYFYYYYYYYYYYHSVGNLPVSKHWQKVNPKDLQIDQVQIFRILMLIWSWLWAMFGSKFWIIFAIS